MMNRFIGFLFHGEILEKTNWEIQLFAPIRSFKDGITFFDFNVNWDRYKSEHTPAFQIELTIFNLYNHIWVYENNFDEELDD
jgi:hypothetical protein